MLRFLYNYLFVSPIRKLYFFGPAYLNFGFWEGQPHAEICARLTAYSATFWEKHGSDCSEMIEKKFLSFQSSLEVSLYFIILFGSLKFCVDELRWWCFTRKRYAILLRNEQETRLLKALEPCTHSVALCGV